MSTEISTLLADVAPRPSGAPDIASIMRRGRRARTNRMLATIVAVPVIAGALWAGAQTGLTRPVETPPAGDPYCNWHSESLMVFLDRDSTRSEGRALARQVRAMDHVKSAEWNDLFEKKVTINSDIPRAMERLARRNFPPWLDIRLDDPSFAGEVADSLPASPVIDAVAGANVRMDECRDDRLEKENYRLRRQVRRLNKKLLREMQRRKGQMTYPGFSTSRSTQFTPGDGDFREGHRGLEQLLDPTRYGSRAGLRSEDR